MVLSSACQDVIRAMVFMSEQKGITQVKNITKELNLPYHFLSKNMQIVSKAGLVDAKRGIDGGVKLAKDLLTFTMSESSVNIPRTSLRVSSFSFISLDNLHLSIEPGSLSSCNEYCLEIT